MQIKQYISARKDEVSMELDDVVSELKSLKGRLERIPLLQKEQRLELIEKLQSLQTEVVVKKSIIAELKHLTEIE